MDINSTLPLALCQLGVGPSPPTTLKRVSERKWVDIIEIHMDMNERGGGMLLVFQIMRSVLEISMSPKSSPDAPFLMAFYIPGF